jgi:phage host-nuclease inhibitor protein Gam
MPHPSGTLHSDNPTQQERQEAMTIADMDLDQFLVSEAQPERFVDETSAFVINNDDEAMWAMQRLAQAQRRLDEVKRQAQVQLDRINAWVAAHTAKDGSEVEFFDAMLSDYLIRVRENEADGRKSIDFPDGAVTSRVTPSKVAVTDAEAFLAWAEANGHSEWIRVKREADVATIKKVVDFEGDTVLDPITGAQIAGLQHTEGGISVSVKVAG